MITFEEAQTLHDALAYDSIFDREVPCFMAPLSGLSQQLDHAIELLGTVEIIVIPWEYAMPFQRQWETVPAIGCVKGWTKTWLWGHYITYRGIDCLASSLTKHIIVSGIRDLRKMYAPEKRIVLIDSMP